MNLSEIERLSFIKYKLSGKKSMNTFIFTQAKINNLTDAQIDQLIINLQKKIKMYQEKEINSLCFTCNLFNEEQIICHN